MWHLKSSPSWTGEIVKRALGGAPLRKGAIEVCVRRVSLGRSSVVGATRLVLTERSATIAPPMDHALSTLPAAPSDLTLANRVEALVADLATRGSILVAYSGGVDSALVAALAFRAVGERALAVTAAAETLAGAELDHARRLAAEACRMMWLVVTRAGHRVTVRAGNAYAAMAKVLDAASAAPLH